MFDHRLNPILVGDTVRIVFAGGSLGAPDYIVGRTMTVTALGRTRAVLADPTMGEFKVHGDVLRVVEAVDGRHLITADEAFAATVATIAATK